MSDAVVQVRDLVRAFGAHRAIDGLSFTVAPGQCFGLLGPNGAGKSTSLRMLLGQLVPDAGSIEVLGLPVPQRAREARARIGVVPQADALDPDFTVTENIRVFARYFGRRGASARRDPDRLLEFAGLLSKRHSRITELSGGMKRRLTLARALVNDPELLILDEPTTGLDPQARLLIWERLRQLLNAGKTILLTTHFMEEAERLCDRIAIIDHGRVLTIDAPEALIARHVEACVLEISPLRGTVPMGGIEVHACERSVRIGDTVLLYLQDDQRAATIAARSDLRVLRRAPNLEDVFLKLTGHELRD